MANAIDKKSIPSISSKLYNFFNYYTYSSNKTETNISVNSSIISPINNPIISPINNTIDNYYDTDFIIIDKVLKPTKDIIKEEPTKDIIKEEPTKDIIKEEPTKDIIKECIKDSILEKNPEKKFYYFNHSKNDYEIYNHDIENGTEKTINNKIVFDESKLKELDHVCDYDEDTNNFFKKTLSELLNELF